MFGKNSIRKLVTTFTAIAVWCVYSSVAYAIPSSASGDISVSGQVTVNGQPAVSNSTFISGSSVTTGAGSRATISLGKAGRVEVQENSTMTLTFSATSIIASLDSGKIQLSNALGVSTSVTTKHATAIADSGQANNFFVQTACADTWVDTVSGMVVLREGTSDKQVAAGSSASAGNIQQAGCKPCLRPGSAPETAVAGWPWLILLAAGAAGAAVFFGTQKEDTTVGGGTVVISPAR